MLRWQGWPVWDPDGLFFFWVRSRSMYLPKYLLRFDRVIRSIRAPCSLSVCCRPRFPVNVRDQHINGILFLKFQVPRQCRYRSVRLQPHAKPAWKSKKYAIRACNSGVFLPSLRGADTSTSQLRPGRCPRRGLCLLAGLSGIAEILDMVSDAALVRYQYQQVTHPSAPRSQSCFFLFVPTCFMVLQPATQRVHLMIFEVSDLHRRACKRGAQGIYCLFVIPSSQTLEWPKRLVLGAHGGTPGLLTSVNKKRGREGPVLGTQSVATTWRASWTPQSPSPPN
ncbi:hypothetical protein BR93DRAFT_199570 [Coniochaeta sp. PMI_546]|nr:hypothetical protein BR93DRAFT_199570 [Coniochaeta sp. PMI_546]